MQALARFFDDEAEYWEYRGLVKRGKEHECLEADDPRLMSEFRRRLFGAVTHD